MKSTERPPIVAVKQSKNVSIRISRQLEGYEVKYPALSQKLSFLADINAHRELSNIPFAHPCDLKGIHALYYERCFNLSIKERLD